MSVVEACESESHDDTHVAMMCVLLIVFCVGIDGDCERFGDEMPSWKISLESTSFPLP